MNPYLQAPTWRKLQLPEFYGSNQKEAKTPLFSGSNLKEAPTPWFSGSNRKEATTPFPCPVLPPWNINVDQLSLPQSMSSSLPLPLSLPLSHQPVTCQLVTVFNFSLVNLSNFSLSSTLNHILSHGSYTKDTSQPDAQHHQHMPLSWMYQDHQHTITRYVSQPCTKSCTKPSTCTIPSINHVSQHVQQQVHQPCTNTCTKSCINHAPTHVLNRASTMHHNMYHMPQTSIMHVKTIPSTNHVPYHVSPIYISTCTIPCTNNVSQPYTISLNHDIHHVP